MFGINLNNRAFNDSPIYSNTPSFIKENLFYICGEFETGVEYSLLWSLGKKADSSLSQIL
ncbi:MAG: hypothetical protein D6714_03715 [Bacteroidetes bacterium]|nr:MAG: hypothetical protein D6714_03715 [Bacteroidota bacterium]